MASHLDKDPPTDDSKGRWLEDDVCLFPQIRNSIDGKVLTHCLSRAAAVPAQVKPHIT